MGSISTLSHHFHRLLGHHVVSPTFTHTGVIADHEHVYLFSKDVEGKSPQRVALSLDGFSFKLDTKNTYRHLHLSLPEVGESSVVAAGTKTRPLYVKYRGDRAIRVSTSHDRTTWKEEPQPVLFDSRPIQIANAYRTKHGILVLYYRREVRQALPQYTAFLALFDLEDPTHLVWRTSEPIWKQTDLWPGKSVKPIGAVMYQHELFMYWEVDEKAVYGVKLSGFTYDPRKLFDRSPIQLEKHIANPIIAPREDHDWEAFTTFNPSAIYADNRVHLVYRAQGYDYISSVGYASSCDGITIESRSPEPIFRSTMDFETNDKPGRADERFISGGGYGGCEDPRLTILGDTVYMTYVAFDGWSPPRLALTCILLDDFLHQRWLWSRPVLISPPGVVDKSGCLLPEKINGKYVFFHRIFPNILIDFVDDLNFNGKDKWLKGQYEIKVRPDKWDSRKIGAGAPPLKTEDGWLLIYYGVDDRDDSKYKVGAMILDLQDPTKVLYRTDQPILEPSEEYENVGFKPGIAYPCGAVIVKDQLLVYYGGADQVVCVAGAPLNQFLSDIKAHHTPKLHQIHIQEVNYTP